MTFIETRIYEIEQKYTHLLRDLLVLSLTDETFRLILALKDGATLRVTERWRTQTLIRYSYYWLDAADKLKIGWDNSPHHQHLETFPHHKHIGGKDTIFPSHETSLEAVMILVEKEIVSKNK